MGKICYINGQPYMVFLPTGGKNKNDKNNQWDDLINFFGEDCNHIFHWNKMSSYCQEKVVAPYPTCVIRGYSSVCHWYETYAISPFVDVGFRPILTPLDTDTLKPKPSLLADIPDGRLFALASLYMDGKVIKNPKNPVSEGDIPNYISGAEITLGDRDPNPANWLWVIKYKELLWADRNILKMISWDNLMEQGFTANTQNTSFGAQIPTP